MDIKSLFRKKSLKQFEDDVKGGGSLRRVFSVKDLTLFGIAAIIGAGIFSTIGRAAFEGGPAISMLFVFVAIACVFTALCYAQFASMIPVSGSAYTYAYASLGELTAWVIGWALILEYAVSNMVVSISWSSYFTTMLQGFGIYWPDWLGISYPTACQAYSQVSELGASSFDANSFVMKAATIYQNAPEIAGIKCLINVPAGLIVIILTALVYIGIKESKIVGNALVYLKVGIILLVIAGGAFFVKPENWSPFMPNGVHGVLGGVAAVFFSFIGFDSISTTAEECKNPQRDLPRAMLICLGICTLLYVSIAFVLTGMVNYKELGVDDPLAYVFQKVDMDFVAGVISVCSVIAITSAILIFQVGQPRIWMSMSRDGLLSPRFAKIHPKFKTPTYATFIAGLLVAVPAFFLDMQFVVDLTSVGTFFAFILVCSGILFLDHKGLSKKAKFKVPYINGQYIIGTGFILTAVLFFCNMDVVEIIKERPLLVFFSLVWLGLSVTAVKYKYSLLPVLGILVNLFLMTEVGLSNWIMFLIWLAIGLVIYFLYGYKKSKLTDSVLP
jgi:amino acid transporter